jgi:hypothetical protein
VFGEFGHGIMSCKTRGEVGDLFHKEVARHGYTSSACRAFVPTEAGVRSSILLFRNWTKEWAKLSDQKGFTANSFAITEARRRMSPFTWRDVPKARPLSAGEREVWDTALAWGWNNGFVLPVHGPGGYFATVSMASPECDLDLGGDNRLHLQMIATLAHERCRVLANLASDESPLVTMSAREREIPRRRRACKARRAHACPGGRSPRAGRIVLAEGPARFGTRRSQQLRSNARGRVRDAAPDCDRRGAGRPAFRSCATRLRTRLRRVASLVPRSFSEGILARGICGPAGKTLLARAEPVSPPNGGVTRRHLMGNRISMGIHFGGGA